MVMGTAITVGG